MPLESACSDFVFSERLLEHLDYPRSAKFFIQECHRILRYGGRLVISVPNFEAMVHAYIRSDPSFFASTRERYARRNIFPRIGTYMVLPNVYFREQDDDEKYAPHSSWSGRYPGL